jgi:ABC-type antimicrobial peptide transport system permease subunit
MRAVIRTFQTAIRALRRNVMRSALTCVGIIIGIAAVIAMTEIGNGVSALNAKKIASLGANNLMIYPGTASGGGFSFGSGSTLTLTAQDCDAILRECSAIRAAAPSIRTGGQLVYGNKNYPPGEINGTSPAYLDVREWPLDEGDCFTEQDVRNTSKVCVIGQTVKRELFGEEDPVGKELRLGPVTMRVVGVLAKKGGSMTGKDQDDVVLAPWTTIKYRVSNKVDNSTASASSALVASASVNSLSNLYPGGSLALYPTESATQLADTPTPVRFSNISTVWAAASSNAEIPTAMKQVTALLRERHRTREGASEDFIVRDMTEFSDALGESTALIGRLLMIVAMISLIVGGVGIMNIMLVSVTERTREIGLRMAVGARARDILYQFLVEAIVLCVLGGIIGIALGRGASLLVRQFMHWPTAISIAAILVSVLVSAVVGLGFGFYPAWKASRLDPIEALRYE